MIFLRELNVFTDFPGSEVDAIAKKEENLLSIKWPCIILALV